MAYMLETHGLRMEKEVDYIDENSEKSKYILYVAKKIGPLLSSLMAAAHSFYLQILLKVIDNPDAVENTMTSFPKKISDINL